MSQELKLRDDPILGEIHRTRREISKRFGGDAYAIVEDAARRMAASGGPVWRPKGPGGSRTDNREQVEDPNRVAAITNAMPSA